MLYGLLAFVSLILTVACFYLYFGNQGANIVYLILAIIFLIGTVGLGGFFLSGRVNRKEDVHITE
jgi:hypothetical protein